VKLDKLLKKLKRDISASPQKAAALGLMVLVALYFWSPLVLKFAGIGGKTKNKKTVASKVILTDDPILTKVAAHPAIDSARWDRARLSLTQDRLMLAAPHREEWKDPFHRLSIVTNSTEPSNSTEPVSQPKGRAQEPAALDESAEEQITGITVSTLLVGKRESAAMIRGTVYRVGDTIHLDGEKGESQLELKVVGIDALGVNLECQGKSFRIERARPKLSPGNHVKQH
jgi:hypothetical protein